MRATAIPFSFPSAGGQVRRRHRSAPLRVVAIGGGTGLPAILAGLARAGRTLPGLPPLEITAVVAVSDDGGSSGRLQREQGVLPPGDVRNCLVALAAPGNRRLARLFQYRFGRGQGLKGHAMGNLLLTALTSLEGDFLAAVDRAGHMLGCAGRVLPCTLDPVQLVARLVDGNSIRGESALERAPRRIARVELRPGGARPAPGVKEAIRAADVVVLGPGSLYSSVIAPLLVEGVAASLQRTRALRIFVQNLMGQPGETEGLDAAGHVRAVLDHAGPVIDLVLVDALQALGPTRTRAYEARGQRPVRLDRRSLSSLGVVPVEAELLGTGRKVRHDPAKAAAAILGLALEAVEA